MKVKRYHNRRKWIPTALGIALFCIIAVWMVRGAHEAGDASEAEALKLAEQAVRSAAVSCYALEGAYPATYEDLKNMSGVRVDEDKYAVFYEIFASNIMPEITVVPKGEMPALEGGGSI